MTQKILLADDSVTIQKVIELTFMDEDYEVTTAGDGEQALERLEEMAPDVVIADVHMPGASGFDVAKRAKQLHPGTPVLLLVGTFEPFDDDDYAASGADSYLKKPFDSQELLQRVDELLASAGDGAPVAASPSETAALPRPGFEDEDDYSLGTASAAGSEPSSGTASTASTREAGTAFSSNEVPPPPPPAAADGGAADEVGGWAATPPLDEEVPTELGAPGTEVTPDAGAGDPFPDLATPASRDSDDDDLFRGLDEADGSSEVLPPPELDEHDEEPVAAMDDDEMTAEEPAWQAEPSWESDAAVDEPAADAAPEDDVQAEVAPGAATVAVSTADLDGMESVNGSVSAPGAGGLSDADVDRIAHRVAEILGGDVVREVAWEVVPDLAEVVIKDRLRELESQVD